MLAAALVGAVLLAPDVPPRPAPARAAARPAPTKAGLSWAEADAMSRKLAVIEERHRQQKAKKSPAVQVTQGDGSTHHVVEIPTAPGDDLLTQMPYLSLRGPLAAGASDCKDTARPEGSRTLREASHPAPRRIPKGSA